MRAKAYIRKEIRKIISHDFNNLILNTKMVVPPGMPCYQYQNANINMAKRYFLVINFGSSYTDRFTFESIWTSDMISDKLPPSDLFPYNGISSSEGCLRIGYLDPSMPRNQLLPFEYIIHNSCEYWWEFGLGEVENTTKPYLDSILIDATKKLQELVMPFFEDMARYHSNLTQKSPLLEKIDQKIKRKVASWSSNANIRSEVDDGQNKE